MTEFSKWRDVMNLFGSKKSTVEISDATIEEIQTASLNRVESSLEEYRLLDEQARIHYKTYQPNIRIEVIGERGFVSIGDVEFCANFVVDIMVSNVGSAPHADYFLRAYITDNSIICAAATPGVVTVRFASGHSKRIFCNRHAIDIVFDAVKTAQKDVLRELEDCGKRGVT